MADDAVAGAQALRAGRSGVDGDAGGAAEPVSTVPRPGPPGGRGAVGVPVGRGRGEAVAEPAKAETGRVEIRGPVLAGGFDRAGGNGGEQAGGFDAGGFAADGAEGAGVSVSPD